MEIFGAVQSGAGYRTHS